MNNAEGTGADMTVDEVILDVNMLGTRVTAAVCCQGGHLIVVAANHYGTVQLEVHLKQRRAKSDASLDTGTQPQRMRELCRIVFSRTS